MKNFKIRISNDSLKESKNKFNKIKKKDKITIYNNKINNKNNINLNTSFEYNKSCKYCGTYNHTEYNCPINLYSKLLFYYERLFLEYMKKQNNDKKNSIIRTTDNQFIIKKSIDIINNIYATSNLEINPLKKILNERFHDNSILEFYIPLENIN